MHNVDLLQHFLEKCILSHCVNKVTSSNEDNTLSVKLNYCYDNIIGLVVHIICSKWTKPKRRVLNETWSAQRIPYFWKNETTGFYESLRGEHGFAPLSPWESLSPFAFSISSGTYMHGTAAGMHPMNGLGHQ